ncbi:hypothetical protein CspHIS471_0405810 [Cutaneotrichosporon sp. HIS471]|nr:hypothetical protein CspHIS471_0405810 [Cutaneotrichosporon sp. HIS471]
MKTSVACTPPTSPTTSTAVAAFTFATPSIRSLTPPTSNPQADLATSLTSSIAALSAAVVVLAKEHHNPTLMATISSVSGTITSLAKVVGTLSRPDVTISGQTNHPAPPNTSHYAPISVEPESERHHSQHILKEKCKQVPPQEDYSPESVGRHCPRVPGKEGKPCLQDHSPCGEQPGKEGKISHLVQESSRVISANERLVSESATLTDDIKRMTSTNHCLADENDLHVDIFAEHDLGIDKIERLSREVQKLTSKNFSLQNQFSAVVEEKATLASKNQSLASKIDWHVSHERDSKNLKEQNEDLHQQVRRLDSTDKCRADRIKVLMEENSEILELLRARCCGRTMRQAPMAGRVSVLRS